MNLLELGPTVRGRSDYRLMAGPLFGALLAVGRPVLGRGTPTGAAQGFVHEVESDSDEPRDQKPELHREER
jgi:hypothetical protein